MVLGRGSGAVVCTGSGRWQSCGPIFNFRWRRGSFHAGAGVLPEPGDVVPGSHFEDVVIFVHDVERCLEGLDDFSREVIARVVLQEYTHEECARLLGSVRRTIARIYPEALDHLSEIFLSVGMSR